MRADRPPFAVSPFLGAGLLLMTVAAQGQPTTTRPPVPSPTAQPRGEIIVYRDRNFAGPAVSIAQDKTNLRLAWPVRSARVRGGTWELCERAGFQGACLTVTRDNRDLGQRLV